MERAFYRRAGPHRPAISGSGFIVANPGPFDLAVAERIEVRCSPRFRVSIVVHLGGLPRHEVFQAGHEVSQVADVRIC